MRSRVGTGLAGKGLVGLVLAGLLVAAPARAETYGDAYGLGPHAADPSKSGRLDGLLQITAALVLADGAPAARVAGRAVVELALSATRAADAGAVRVRLHCAASFTDADNNDAPGAAGLCFDGSIGAGETVPLRLKLKFRGSAADAAASYGVAVEVRDEISGEAISLMPTWGWAGP